LMTGLVSEDLSLLTLRPATAAQTIIVCGQCAQDSLGPASQSVGWDVLPV